MYTHNQHIDLTDLPSKEPVLPDGGEKQEKRGSSKSADAGLPKDNRKVSFKELIDGTFLVRENIIRQLPFVLFLTLLGVIYIGNRFHAERMVRQISELKTEVGNLRAEQITTTSELMNISRPSEVTSLVESRDLGLKESMVPPKKLKRK
ncbi:MAG TPA: FtsL-like putative cell division protein [Bacteroidales bacterium]|nr:FtsL-like putative cell division protein [Bacteroidales bacterium]